LFIFRIFSFKFSREVDGPIETMLSPNNQQENIGSEFIFKFENWEHYTQEDLLPCKYLQTEKETFTFQEENDDFQNFLQILPNSLSPNKRRENSRQRNQYEDIQLYSLQKNFKLFEVRQESKILKSKQEEWELIQRNNHFKENIAENKLKIDKEHSLIKEKNPKIEMVTKQNKKVGENFQTLLVMEMEGKKLENLKFKEVEVNIHLETELQNNQLESEKLKLANVNKNENVSKGKLEHELLLKQISSLQMEDQKIQTFILKSEDEKKSRESQNSSSIQKIEYLNLKNSGFLGRLSNYDNPEFEETKEYNRKIEIFKKLKEKSEENDEETYQCRKQYESLRKPTNISPLENQVNQANTILTLKMKENQEKTKKVENKIQTEKKKRVQQDSKRFDWIFPYLPIFWIVTIFIFLKM
jgi:hypothetical protein